MRYYECPGCTSPTPDGDRPTRLADFDGGFVSIGCPKCGTRAKYVMTRSSGLDTDFHRPAQVKGPKPGWKPGRTRRSTTHYTGLGLA